MENKDENIVWHYTKMNVIKEMLQQDSVKIRFTNARFTNDPSESLVAREFFKNNKDNILINLKDCKIEISEGEFDEQIKNTLRWDNSYIFSMTYLQDSFAFWNKEYAGTDGVAIGFEKDIMKPTNTEKKTYSTKILYVDPYRLINNANDNKLKDVSKLISNYYKTIPPEHTNSIKGYGILKFFLDCNSTSFKHKTWEYEDEIRIIMSNSYEILGEEIKVLNDKFTPQIDFFNNKVTQNHYENFDKNIVKKIILGPDCGHQHVKAIEDYLVKNEYKNIQVSRSTTLDLRYQPIEDTYLTTEDGFILTTEDGIPLVMEKQR